MNDVALAIILTVLGGGLLTALKAWYNARVEKRKTTAEAVSLEIKSPEEARNLAMMTMTAALNGARSINQDNESRIGRMETQMKEMIKQAVADRKQARLDRQQQDEDRGEIRKLRRAVDASEEYVDTLLSWIEHHIPGVKPPVRKYNHDRD